MRQDFINQYMAARAQVFTLEIILKAWKNSGIRPLNPHIFKDQDFEPSMATSTEAHAPSSYPIQPHELLDLDDITTDLEDDGSHSERSDTEDEDLRHSSDSGSDSKNGTESDCGAEVGSSKTVQPLTDHPRGHQSVASPLPSTPHPIRSTTMPPAVLKLNPELALYFLSLEDKVSQLTSRVQSLESNAEAKTGELEAAKAHCALALGQIGALNKRLNKKKGKKS